MTQVFTHLGVFCLGMILGLGEENDYLNAGLLFSLFAWFVVANMEVDHEYYSEDEEEIYEEVEERRPATRIVKNPYYNRYKP